MEFEPPESSPWLTPLRAEHWGYKEVVSLFAVALAALLAVNLTALNLYQYWSGVDDPDRAVEAISRNPYIALTVQMVAWAPVLLYIYYVVAVAYRREFLEGIGWSNLAHPPLNYVAGGVFLMLSVALIAAVIGVPEESYPMQELFEDPESLWLLGLFGVLAAPAIEEVVFRGFLFAALEHAHGTAAALVATSIVFSLVHGGQYGWQWRNLLVLLWVGLVLGAVRAQTGSTKAATLVHAAYNGMIFLALFAVGDQAPPP